MPNRIIRADILTSERVNKLSIQAECFYRRLMSIVDDYGRYHGNLTLLRSSCFPLRIDTVKEKGIAGWIAECEEVGILSLYTINGKNYLEIDNFGQQRRSKSKFPEPEVEGESAIICEQMLSDADKCSPSRSRKRSRSRDEAESKKADSKKAKRISEMGPEEYLEDLIARPEFEGIDVRREVELCRKWCEKGGHTLGRNRIVNWLKRSEKPINIKTESTGPRLEVVR